MVNPLDMETFDRLSFRSGLRVVPCITTPTEIVEAVNCHYPKGAAASSDWWTVLVVDDQELVRFAVLAALNRGGFNTLQAANGAKGSKPPCSTSRT